MSSPSKIVGIIPVAFQGRDGGMVEGKSLFVTAPLDPTKGGEGCSAEKIFLSKARFNDLDFTPKVGDEVEILYNRFGKVAVLRKVPTLDVPDIEI